MRLAILGSGSTGNVAFIEAAQTRVLVDAGLSVTTIEERLLAMSPPVALDAIDAVLVTHEHSDHVGCAGKLGRPIFAPGPTLRRKGLEGTRVRADERFRIGAIEVHPVMLLHDAEETVGYVLGDGRYRIGILTDCGEPDLAIARAYAGCDILVLEANHDPYLLVDGPYPPSLQRRVRGPRGHLSNPQSARMLAMILEAGPAPAAIVAAHVSQKNNHPDLVERALGPLVPSGTRFLQATPRGAPELALPLLPLRGQLSLFLTSQAQP